MHATGVVWESVFVHSSAVNPLLTTLTEALPCTQVGTFVRHIPADAVPRELKRHLFSIEEKILEAQAWERSSSLYPLLVSACAPLQPPPAPNADDVAMSDSPPLRKVRPGFRVWGIAARLVPLTPMRTPSRPQRRWRRGA